jgi:hypothetical protein
MPRNKGGKSAATAAREAEHAAEALREDILDWMLSSALHKLRQLPESDDQIEALIDGCIERGLNSSALTCNGWQIVLEAGTLRLIELDVVLSGPPPPGATFSPPVFTPSRKHAHSASAEDPLAMPSFTMSGMPGTPTPAPIKRTRWADDPAPLFMSPLLQHGTDSYIMQT